MSDTTIHNFQYFLKELENNLRKMDSLREQEAMELERMYVLDNGHVQDVFQLESEARKL